MRFVSFFSGIGAPECAWSPLGWDCLAVAEIDKAASAVLAHHYPDVPNLGDIEHITEDRLAALGPIDLIVGGFPCQDVSHAGKRKGLVDVNGKPTRSGLFFAAMRLVRIARRRSGLRWVCIENVPGLLNSNSGRDFGTVVAEICGTEFGVPGDGWRNAGAAVGPDGFVEWASLDARYRGLAQRRERVFLVADFGNWADRAPILLEPENMCGNFEKGETSRQDIAGTLSARTSAGGGLGTDFDLDGGLIAFGGNNQSGPVDLATACRAKGGTGHGDFESETFIFDPNQITNPDNRSQPRHGEPCHTLPGQPQGPILAFSCKDYGQDVQTDVTPTLRAMNEEHGHANAGGQVAVAFDLRGREGGAQFEGPHNTANMRAASGGSSRSYVAERSCVRRLLPVECEALQGFPRGWTEFKASKNGPVRQADGPRYRQLGNSMAVPIMLYIGQKNSGSY